MAATAPAQSTQLDSLELLIIKAASETARINLINQKIRLLTRVNLDSA
ncbi:hypothetical protein [Adhaeribacter radiodurans]|uniref:Uncharacterized protein n=1 Tax=Adhaeribacter radiodurans TaxID=2745197 RepID=A0A7L7L677_9BACT|nr:hypothetical protein [Adhaeribacter radiodurans]QMU28336.1 hypothetical protein HUW48_09960 [Adhaeribacter radiodurans]